MNPHASLHTPNKVERAKLSVLYMRSERIVHEIYDSTPVIIYCYYYCHYFAVMDGKGQSLEEVEAGIRSMRHPVSHNHQNHLGHPHHPFQLTAFDDFVSILSVTLSTSILLTCYPGS